MLFYHSFRDYQEIMDCFAALAMTMDTALLAMTVVSICPSGYSTTVGLHKCLAEIAAEVLNCKSACVDGNW